MGNAKGNVISAQVFVSGERRYWAEKKKNKQENYTCSVIAISIAMGQKDKTHIVDFSA